MHGPHAEWLLESQCPLPLNLRDFPVGMCTRTVFAKTEIVLWRAGEQSFHVEVWRSFASYLLGLLHEVARECRWRDLDPDGGAQRSLASAKSTAARACSTVESTSGTVASPGPTSSINSVQDSRTASAPAATSSVIVSRRQAR